MTLFRLVQLLLLYLLFQGLTFFRLETNGKAKFCKGCTVFFALLNLATPILFYYCNWNVFMLHTSTLISKLTTAYFSLSIFKIVTSALSRLYYMHDNICVWKDLLSINEQLLKYGIQLELKAISRAIYALVVFILLTKILGLWYLIKIFEQLSIVQFMLYIVLQYLDLCTIGTEVEFMMFQLIIQNYMRELGRRKVNDAEITFIKFYNDLRDLCKKSGKVFSIPILNLLLVSSTIMTTLSYSVLSKIYHSKNTMNWFMTIDSALWWLFCAFANLLCIIIPAHICMRNANNIKKTLRNININKHDPSVARNVKSFSLQLLHEDFKITAGGLFTIDLRLAYMVIGALTTYITIIVQFDLMYFK